MLAFLGPDRLISARVETRDGTVLPTARLDLWKEPVVARVRNLLGPEPLKPTLEITDLEVAIPGDALTPSGKFLVLDGVTGPRGKTRHLLNGYEVATGRRIWSLDLQIKPDEQYLRMEPRGSILTFRQRPLPAESTLIEIATGKLVRTAAETDVLGPGAASGFTGREPQPDARPGLTFWQWNQGSERILFRLELDSNIQSSATHDEFTRDGRFAGIGNFDGSVLVVDLVEVNRRLTEVNLGW
jgi:hypothetical protein